MKLKRILILLLLSFMIVFPSVSTTQTRIYKVAILPFLIHSQENLDYLREGIHDILLSRITVEGRITVIDRTIVERALYEEQLAGSAFRAEGLVLGLLHRQICSSHFQPHTPALTLAATST